MCFVATAACQRILEAMLPNAWRTASPGFAGCGVRTKLSEQKDGKEFWGTSLSMAWKPWSGAAEFGQKAWRNEGIWDKGERWWKRLRSFEHLKDSESISLSYLYIPIWSDFVYTLLPGKAAPAAVMNLVNDEPCLLELAVWKLLFVSTSVGFWVCHSWNRLGWATRPLRRKICLWTNIHQECARSEEIYPSLVSQRKMSKHARAYGCPTCSFSSLPFTSFYQFLQWQWVAMACLLFRIWALESKVTWWLQQRWQYLIGPCQSEAQDRNVPFSACAFDRVSGRWSLEK